MDWFLLGMYATLTLFVLLYACVFDAYLERVMGGVCCVKLKLFFSYKVMTFGLLSVQV